MVQPQTRWRVLREAWREDPSEVFACSRGSRLYLLDAADDERVMPSPASSLARYELAERVGGLEVRHALQRPATPVARTAPLPAVVAALVASHGRPLLVADTRPPRVLRAELLLAWLVGDGEEETPCTWPCGA